MTLADDGKMRIHPSDVVRGRALTAFGLLALGYAAQQRNRNRRLTSEAETTANARFQAIIEEAQDFFFVIAENGEITYRSPSVVLAGGERPPEHLDDLLDLLGGTDREIARTVFYDTSKANGTLKVPLETALGSHWIELHLNDQRDNPAVRGIIITGRDVTEAENLSRQLREQAELDELTRLPNRWALAKATNEAIARSTRSGTSAALLVIDLDGFKGVNDTLGHPTGDRLLRAVAQRLEDETRRTETLARLGGDEFAIVVSNVVSPDDIGALARRLLDTMIHPFEIDGQQLMIGASIGYVVTEPLTESATEDPGAGTSSDELLQHADIALYEAKRQRGRSVRFTPDMRDLAEMESRLIQELELGFERGEFFLEYQPVVSTNNVSTVAFEALMRWHSPALGSVPPTTFIPIAERTGAIGRMGRWALQEACERLAAWIHRYPTRNLSMSVNVSLLQLVDQDFPNIVADVLASTGVEPDRLQLEITESVLAHDPDRIVAALQEIRRTGVRVALDDFGTGYSSMAQPQTLPVDCVKIDKAFIDRIESSARGASAVRAIVDLARALDVSVVAEGVEDEGQLLALLDQQVELAQGYLFAQPLGSARVEAFLDRDLAYLI